MDEHANEPLLTRIVRQQKRRRNEPRPTTGSALFIMRSEFSLQRNSDLEWILGMTPGQLCASNAAENTDRELQGLSRAAIVRHLLENPDAWPLPKDKSPRELYERIRAFMPFSRAQLGVLLGRSMLSGSRWTSEKRTDDGISVDVVRLLMLINNALDRAKTTKDKIQVVEHFMSLMVEEADARGYDLDQLASKGRWVRPKDREPPPLLKKPVRKKPA
jgi:hypothetical protein